MADPVEVKVGKIRAQGEVIPPALARPLVSPLPDGQVKVEIIQIFDENPSHDPKLSENIEVRVKYPTGFIKGHQIAKEGDAVALVAKIRNQLRGMHGGARNGALLSKLPAQGKDLTTGMILIFEGDK